MCAILMLARLKRDTRDHKMKRVILITFLLTLPIILILVMISVEESQPDDWKVELDKYLIYREGVISDTIKTKIVDAGAMPWHFSRVMSSASFGESPFFDIDYGYDGKRTDSDVDPLPYPPQALWCVLVTRDETASHPVPGDPSYSVVIIAQHQEDDHVATVVHELSSGHIPLAQSLAIVGCSKVVEEIQFEEAAVWT
jgi:hypothetical protein